MNQLLCHLIGDYIFQSPYMALNKNNKTIPCLIHCILYTLPFLFLTSDVLALFLIFATHFIEDRFYFMRYVVWLKNHLNPKFKYFPFDKCSVTGYYDDWHGGNEYEKEVQPKFITTWIYIISDNTYHLACNFLILKYLG